jgi:hypothetical protein
MLHNESVATAASSDALRRAFCQRFQMQHARAHKKCTISNLRHCDNWYGCKRGEFEEGGWGDAGL